MSFDFNEWAELNKVDPEAFEKRREAALNDFVASVDQECRHGLEQTRFRMEMIRKRAKSPLQSALESSRLMWESFGKLREQLDNLQTLMGKADLHQNGLRLVGTGSATVAEVAATENQQGSKQSSARVISLKRKLH